MLGNKLIVLWILIGTGFCLNSFAHTCPDRQCTNRSFVNDCCFKHCFQCCTLNHADDYCDSYVNNSYCADNCCNPCYESENEYQDACEVRGPCPRSACTRWPLNGTTTPRPLPDAHCPYHGAGFLGGLQAGWGETHWDITQANINELAFPLTTLDPTSISTDGLAARIYIGYDFSYYFGIESGFTYMPEADASGIQINRKIRIGFPNPLTNSVSGKISNYTLDLLAKVMWPITDRLGVYLKAGGAYYRSGTSGILIFSDDEGNTQSESLNHIGPAMGLGVFFHIVPRFTADISWMRFYGNTNFFTQNSNDEGDTQPSPDVFLLGISFKFAPRYVD